MIGLCGFFLQSCHLSGVFPVPDECAPKEMDDIGASYPGIVLIFVGIVTFAQTTASRRLSPEAL